MANVNSNSKWEMNPTQKDFVAVLKGYENGAMLKDIELDTGKVFKTGSINTLVSKGIVEVIDNVVAVDLVYRGVVIGQVNKTWKIYRLVNKDQSAALGFQDASASFLFGSAAAADRVDLFRRPNYSPGGALCQVKKQQQQKFFC